MVRTRRSVEAFTFRLGLLRLKLLNLLHLRLSFLGMICTSSPVFAVFCMCVCHVVAGVFQHLVDVPKIRFGFGILTINESAVVLKECPIQAFLFFL